MSERHSRLPAQVPTAQGSASDRSPGRRPIVIAITGASGVIYAVRLLQVLARCDLDIELTISPSGAAVIQEELNVTIDLDQPHWNDLLSYVPAWTQRPSDAPRSAAATAAPADPSTDPPVGDPASLAGTSDSIGAPDAANAADSADAADAMSPDGAAARFRYHRYDDYLTPIASGSFRTAAMVVCPCSGSTLSGIARAAASNLIQRAAEVHLKERRRLVLVPRETPLSALQLENMQRVVQAGAVLLPAMPGWYHGVDSLDSLVDFVVSRILDQLQIDNMLIGRWGET